MSNETTESNNAVLMTQSTTIQSMSRKTTLDSIMITPGLTLTSTLNESSFKLSSSTIFNDSTTSQTVANSTFYSNPTYPPNITDEEKHQYLSYLQEQTTKAMIPAMIYLIILATVGLVGNVLVLFVYSRKFKQTSTRIFIMAIASFDIVTNVVAIPGEIYDMFHIWDFDQPMVCKTRLFVNAFTTMVAAMVLVAVAVVRYRKICKPFKTQVSVELAKSLSVSLALLSLTFSIPYAIINGRQTKRTPRDDISGYECTIDDSYIKTIWPMINGAFFIFLFVACCIPLVVMYVLIGITAWKHSRIHGSIVYTKGKKESKQSDSGNTNETSTKSTDESALKFTKSPKTRSFVKNKGDSSGGLPAPSSQKENDNKNLCYNNQLQDNKGKSHNDKSQCNNCEDNDENNTENVYGASKTEQSKSGASIKTKSNNCDIRTVRSPTGETVHINLLMVKELTMKLKAVKKEAESLTDKNDDNCSEPWKADYEDKAFMSSVKTSEDFNDKTQNIDRELIDKSHVEENVVKEDRKIITKKKIHRNKSADISLCDEVGKLSTSAQSKRVSKSLADLSRLTVAPILVKDKKKAAENEDIDLRTDAHLDRAGVIERQETTEREEAEAPKDEQMSEFAKAMQWVDLTYCLKEDQKENENETNGEEPDVSTLSKKGSFAHGRKISRDNSFLQRHKKLKDALTDTLTRARRNRKDREAAEAESKDNNGNATLENINSESENMGNEDSSDNPANERRTSEPAVQHEAKALKRKPSGIKEDLTSDESGNTVTVSRNRSKRRGIGRTTCMLILISAVYIFGFLPFLGLMFAKAASPNTFLFMNIAPQALYNLFLRSYFLNSAANPIIYSLCDINFRRECIALLRRS